MEDTSITFAGKRLSIASTFKSFLLYATADVVMSLIQSLSGMTQESWDKMSWHQQVAFWLAPVGSLALAAKMFYSNSSPTTGPKPTTLTT